MAREVGLPLMRDLLAYARGEYDQAVLQLQPAQAHSIRLGGSHAQRDLLDLTLIAAARRAIPGLLEWLRAKLGTE